MRPASAADAAAASQPPPEQGSAEVGAGYGDRTRLGGFSKLVMARDFWHQALEPAQLTATRCFPSVDSCPPESSCVVETFWTASDSLTRGPDSRPSACATRRRLRLIACTQPTELDAGPMTLTAPD